MCIHLRNMPIFFQDVYFEWKPDIWASFIRPLCRFYILYMVGVLLPKALPSASAVCYPNQTFALLKQRWSQESFSYVSIAS